MIKKNEDLIKEVDQLKSERGNFEIIWQEIGDLMLPRKNDVNSFKSPGAKRNSNILDNTAMNSLELLAGHLHGLMTSSANPFFELTTGDYAIDNRDDVRRWFQDTVDRMHIALANSNFQTEVYEFYLDLCGPCTAAMTILEDPETDFVFKTHFLKEIFIKENAKGVVDTVYRCFEWSARKIVEEYGEKKCPPSVIDAWKSQKPDQLFEVIQAVYPQDPLGEKKKGFRFPIVSHHVLKKDKYTLKLHGFNEQVWVVARWAKASGEDYGRGPGVNALPETRMVNLMEEVVIKSAQLALGPPLQAPDEGFSGGIKIKPYGISYYRSGSNNKDRIEQIFDVPRIDFSSEIMAQRRQRIKESFYVDQLQVREADRQTTVEITQRSNEQMRFLGPLAGRLGVEMLRPMIDRVFAIMSRRNRFSIPPEIIQGKKLAVKYSSAIAKIQRISEAQNTHQFLANLAPLTAIDPRVLQNINADEAFRGVAAQYGFPQRYIRDQDDVDKIREQEAKMAQEQAAMEKQIAEAEVIKNTTPAITAAQEQLEVE